MHSVYLLTGSNLGDRRKQLQKAIQELEQLAGAIEQTSSIFETEAWGKEGLPPHLNQAILLRTSLSPLHLLAVIHTIEENLGRVRQEKWGVRVIDIDIIYFDDTIIDLPTLKIPHPLLHLRNFVLQPLCEIAPDFLHPIFQLSNEQLRLSSTDTLAAGILA